MGAAADGELREALAAGIRAHDEGRLEDAEKLLARAVSLDARSFAAHAALGQVRMDLGRHVAALEAFQAAVALQPTARGWNNAGIALEALERREEALRAFERAAELDSRYALARFNLARLHAPSDVPLAFEHAQAAVQADPSNADAWILLSDILRRQADHANAMRAANLAIQRSPRRAAPWTARAALLAEMDRTDDAKGEYAAAWERFPGDLRAALGACLILPRVYRSHEHLEASRAAYAAGLERLHEAADRFRFRDAESALLELRWVNFYLAYQGRDDRDFQQRYGAFQRRVLERAAPDLFLPRERHMGRDRIRVGFLSHYFYNCVVGRYFSSWVTRLDPARFERIVYYTNAWVGDDTRAIAASADTFRHVASRPLASIARQVVADELDVLVFPEVGMHPDIVTFSSMRLAPVQVMGWGHPTTSGSASIDWYLSSAPMEPANAQAHYAERLAFLPGLGTRYEMPPLEGTASRAQFGLPEDRTLYLVPQSVFKIHPDNDAVIARVLASDDRGVVLMFASSHEESTRALRARLDAALAAQGVDPARVAMLEPNLQHAAYMKLNAVCDVMLDTLHWSGGNTSIDAIAAGLPIVTLPGALMRGRQSAAMLGILGLDELVAKDADDYVRKAVRIGNDRARRPELSQRIRERREALFARDEPIRALEDFLVKAAG